MSTPFFLFFLLGLCLSDTSAFHNDSFPSPIAPDFLPSVVHQSALDKWVQSFKNCGGSLTIKGHSGIKPATKISAKIKPACRKNGSRPFAKAIYGWDAFKRFVYKKKTGKTAPKGKEVPQLRPIPWARCHIIANQLGGKGNVYANLFPCWQTKFNTPAMSDCENVAARELKAGNTVLYDTTLEYKGSNSWPASIIIEVERINKNRKRSKLYKVRIENTEQAKLTNI
eukprot:gb/GEZJ01003974.1/.p1 GENE.gb/GEZJ01003974.1/~~gb/GEZJ01003974.1/.p1  ORF type:complete len:226 (-),score=14.91 gb/GEZJ01003974.1/:242-919(-)